MLWMCKQAVLPQRWSKIVASLPVLHPGGCYRWRAGCLVNTSTHWLVDVLVKLDVDQDRRLSQGGVKYWLDIRDINFPPALGACHLLRYLQVWRLNLTPSAGIFWGFSSGCSCCKVLWGSVFRDLEAAFGSLSSQSMHETVCLTINRPLAPWLHPVPSRKEEHHHRGLHSYAMICDVHPWLVGQLCLWDQCGNISLGMWEVVGWGSLEVGCRTPSQQVCAPPQWIKNVKYFMQVAKKFFMQTAKVSPLYSRQDCVQGTIVDILLPNFRPKACSYLNLGKKEPLWHLSNGKFLSSQFSSAKRERS